MNNLELFKILVAAGADLEVKNKDGWTILIEAAYEGYTDIVELLLNSGANPNAIDKNMYTALMLASYKKHLKIVELLINHGADPNLENNFGRTALGLALDGYDNKISKLLAYKTNVNLREYFGWRVLMFASFGGYKDLVELLLDNASKSDSGDQSEWLAFSINPNRIRPIDLNAYENFGLTVLSYASLRGHTNVVDLLIDRGAYVNMQDGKGKTALMYASERNEIDVVQLLLSHGADVSIKDNEGETALMKAVREDVIDLLKKHEAEEESDS